MKNGGYVLFKTKLRILISNEEYHIQNMKTLLKTFPKGKLYTRKRGNRYNYSVYQHGKEKWITRNRQLVERYQRKEQLELYLSRAQQTYKVLNHFLKELPGFDYDDPFLMQWANEEYEKNNYKEEQLLYKTLKGPKVRSKSERFIADALFNLHIPYRYECAMYFNGHKIYPDFVILKPNGEFIIWEHFGLLDDDTYRNNAIRKVELYGNAGYVQHHNLICTKEEDLKDVSVILDIVQRFYLS